MKKKIYIFIISINLFIPSNNLKAQEKNNKIICSTTLDEKSKEFYEKNKATINYYKKQFLQKNKKSKSNTIEISIPIKAHIIRENNGMSGVDLQEIKSSIERLNNTFNVIGMSFFLCGNENYIDNSSYFDLDLSTEESSLLEQHAEDNVINLFYLNSIKDYNNISVSGLAYYPGGHDVIYVTNNFINTSVIEHEMGHFFSLLHTHGQSNTELTTELVDGSNCDTDGDEICDTPADPKLGSHNMDSNCNYFGDLNDKNGDKFAPKTNNLMSYALKNCRTNFTEEQYARMYAVSRSVRNYFECPTFKADFSFELEASCTSDKTKVTFSDVSSGATSWQWDIDNDGTIDYTERNPIHEFNKEDNYTIKLTIKNNEGFIAHKSYSKFVPVGSKSMPYTDFFEELSTNQIKGWEIENQENSDYKWELNSGITQSGGGGLTGPLGDNSSNFLGNYFYANASAGVKNDTASLISPCIKINSADALLSFTYHMYGAHVGELHIDIDSGEGFNNDIVPPIIGSQQSSQSDSYILKQINLSQFKDKNIRIRFRAIRGRSLFGDIAIDDFKISNSSILNVNDYKIASIKVYPNPIIDEDVYVQSKELIDTIIVYNVNGINLLKKYIKAKDYRLKTKYFSSGVYFIKIISGSRSNVFKIVKK